MSYLRLEHVTISVGTRQLVDDVSFVICRGEWVSLLGPNGAGKTTLLGAIAGLRRYDGAVEVAGVAPRNASARRLARLVTLVPQQPVIPEELTVAEYVLLGRTPHLGYLEQETRADSAVVRRILADVGLGPFSGRRLDSLSGGEQQRAVLARALAQEAPLLLLDEPTASLDIGRQREVLDLVDRLRSEAGLTVLAAVHDLTLAAQYGDRLLLLADGRVVAEGTAAEVLVVDRMRALYGVDVRLVHDGGRFVGLVPLRGGE